MSSILIVVLATDHPEEDAWVIERASEEADKSRIDLPTYQGLGDMPGGVKAHMYCTDPEVADRARAAWAGQIRAESDGEVDGG